MPIISQQSLDLLVSLINQSNPGLPVPVTKTNVKFGTPAVYTPSGGAIQNTSIKVTALASGQFIGNDSLTYRRLDMGTLFRSVPIAIFKYSPAATNASPYKISDLLNDINTKYGLSLTTADIVDGALPAGTTNAQPAIGLAAGTRNASINVAMASNSYGYVGSFTLYWVQAPQDISTMISVASLENARVYPGNRNVVDNTVYVVDLDAYNFDWTDLFTTLGIIVNGVYTNPYLTTYYNGQQPTANSYGAAWQGVITQLNTNNGSGGPPYTFTNGTDPGNVKGNLYGATATLVDLTVAANQAAYPEANYKYYNKCFVVDVPASKTWAAGRLYLHFNG
jgi:hypothetical protein